MSSENITSEGETREYMVRVGCRVDAEGPYEAIQALARVISTDGLGALTFRVASIDSPGEAFLGTLDGAVAPESMVAEALAAQESYIDIGNGDIIGPFYNAGQIAEAVDARNLDWDAIEILSADEVEDADDEDDEGPVCEECGKTGADVAVRDNETLGRIILCEECDEENSLDADEGDTEEGEPIVVISGKCKRCGDEGELDAETGVCQTCLDDIKG